MYYRSEQLFESLPTLVFDLLILIKICLRVSLNFHVGDKVLGTLEQIFRYFAEFTFISSHTALSFAQLIQNKTINSKSNHPHIRIEALL